MKTAVILTINHLNFKVKILDRLVLSKFNKVISSLKTYEYKYNPRTKRKELKLDRVYIGTNSREEVYHLPISYLKTFLSNLANELPSGYLTPKNLKIIRNEIHEIEKCNVYPSKTKIPREYQEKYITEILKDRGTPFSLVEMQTGAGKTLTSMTAATRLNNRTLIVVLPRYMEKWKEDIISNTDAIPEDIRSVSGGKELNQLIQDGLNDNIEEGFIIVSLRTLSNYIKLFELTPNMKRFKYDCIPEDFCKVCKIGHIVNDETHQEFFAVFKMTLYLDVPKFTGLTATLISDNSNITRLHKILYPDNSRITNIIGYNRYIHAHNRTFKFGNPRTIKHMSVQGYNHGFVEQSVMSNRNTLKNYVDMFINDIERFYMTDYEDGDKCLVFCASIKMCTYLTKVLRSKYNHLDVRRYVENDSYDNILDGELIISTVLSSGTAIDVPGLTTVIQTNSIKSSQSNIQALGRLREIKGRDVNFIFYCALNIPMQVDYNKHRFKLFKPRTKTLNRLTYNTEI